MNDGDTIAAVATPAGRGGIGIVRISGPEALRLAAEVFRGERSPLEAPGYAALYGWVEDNGERLDEVLCLVMRAPRSYTREDVAEFHCHGGPVPLRRVLEAVLKRGARLAKPGEFTRRAFLNGRIDLSRAEAVFDLIQSMTDASARAALGQLAGGLADEVRKLREDLLRVLAELEAGIDFPEEDIEFISRSDLRAEVEKLLSFLKDMIADGRRGRIIRDGLSVVIAGRPNVGKSTLMNALLKQDRVIVNPHPGTTRDVIEEALDLEGLAVRLSDTAGVRDDSEGPERDGVSRSIRAVEGADLVLLMLDASASLTREDERLIQIAGSKPALLLLNKSDLPRRLDTAELEAFVPGLRSLVISALTGQGLDELKKNILETALGDDNALTEPPPVTNLRHLESLEKAAQALTRSIEAIDGGFSEEFISADLRGAVSALGEVSGESVSEEVLDLIFSRFCIGK